MPYAAEMLIRSNIAHGHAPAYVLVMVDTSTLQLDKDGHHPKTAFTARVCGWGARWPHGKLSVADSVCHRAVIAISNGANGLTYTYAHTHINFDTLR